MKITKNKCTLYLILCFIAATLFQTANAADNTAGLKNGVVVYYFHGNQRCVTCMNIEELSKVATEKVFSNKLKNGSIKFVSVNVDNNNNEHFIEDYQLIVRSVVIAKIEDGKETKWRRLDKVWNLHNNPEQFIKYFNDEATQLLKEK